MRKGKVMGIALACVVMGGALVYYNFIDKAPMEGMGEGNVCFDFMIETYDKAEENFSVGGETVTLSDQIGKVCVLNFWETWCAVCIEEMHAFNQIQEEFGEKVNVYALAGVTSTPQEIEDFLNNGDWNAYDKENDWSTFSVTFGYMPFDKSVNLGYGGILPRTIIIDKSGIILYEDDGKMTYEKLKDIIEDVL